MPEAAHKEASALSEEDAQCFWLARTALRGYLAVRSELHWRVRNLYNKTDAFTKAVEALGGVEDFQSCADECAYSVARARGGDAFTCLGLEHWMDAFYGKAWNIESRADEWSEKLHLNASRPKRRRLSVSTSSLLDRALLRDLGARATSFMAAVRQLPYFKKDWNKKELTVRAGPLLLADGRLDARERKFLRKLAKAQEILEARPLCAQDKRDVLLCLCRFVPGSAARVVSQFVFHPHEMARPAAT